MYEANFFAMQALNFVYKKHNATTEIELSLDVVHVEDYFSKITVMHQGILYVLRSGHPVIDGVGFFIQSYVKWLVFIQILSDYKYHDKKLSSVFKDQKLKPCQKKSKIHHNHILHHEPR